MRIVKAFQKPTVTQPCIIEPVADVTREIVKSRNLNGPRCILYLVSIIGVMLITSPAYAERRVALVIGNSAYQAVPRLSNPINDAAAISTMLKKAGFDVVENRNDLTMTEMRRTLREFLNKTRDADIAVIYYAGHGVEVDGTNYLMPTDARLESDTDVFDEALALERVLVAVEPARQLRLVILDACRDNPFVRKMKRTVALRSVGRGLAKVEPDNPNTLIAFAAKAGFTALDGENNSPFTTALVRHLPTPGLDLRKAFGFVRDDVLKATGNRQEPFVYGSLGGNDIALVPPLDANKPGALTPQADIQAAIRRDYDAALQVGTQEAWDFFIATYPHGLYAKLALAQRNKLALTEERNKVVTGPASQPLSLSTKQSSNGAKPSPSIEAATPAIEIPQESVPNRAPASTNRTTDVWTPSGAALGPKADLEQQRKPLTDPFAEALATSGRDQKMASLPPAQPAPGMDSGADRSRPPASASMARLLLAELRRVGCNKGGVSDDWTTSAQNAMAAFNKRAGEKFALSEPTAAALEAVKSRSPGICPLNCEPGYRATASECIKIVCGPGQVLGRGNVCREKGQRTATRPDTKPDVTPKSSSQSLGSYAASCVRAQAACIQLGGRPERCGHPERLAMCTRIGIWYGPNGVNYPLSKQ